MISDEALRDLENLVEWHLRAWRGHRDWEDLRQEAIIRAWKTVERVENLPAARFSTIVCRSAAWALREFMYPGREWKDGKRTRVPRVKPLSLEEVEEREFSGIGMEGDFAARVLDAIECDELLAEIESLTSEEVKDMLWRTVGLGELQGPVGRQYHCSVQTLQDRIRRALALYREAHKPPDQEE